MGNQPEIRKKQTRADSTHDPGAAKAFGRFFRFTPDVARPQQCTEDQCQAEEHDVSELIGFEHHQGAGLQPFDAGGIQTVLHRGAFGTWVEDHPSGAQGKDVVRLGLQ